MVNYKFESVQMLKSSVSELEVEQKLADIRMQLSEASLEMKSVDAVLDSVTLALDVIHNYKGEDEQIIDLINCGGAMERLLGVAEKDITVSASEEGLGNVLKTIWEKIKQFIAWLIQKIKDFGVWIGKKLGLVKDDVKDLEKEFDAISKDVSKKTEESLKKVFENAKVAIDKRGVEMMNEMLREVNEKSGTNHKASGVKASLEDYTTDKQNQIVRFYHKSELLKIVDDLSKISKLLSNDGGFIATFISKALEMAEKTKTAPEVKEGLDKIREEAENLSSDATKKVLSSLSMLKMSDEGWLTFKKEPLKVQGSMASLGYSNASDCQNVLREFDKYLTGISTLNANSRKLISELERIDRTIKSKDANTEAAKTIRVGLRQMHKFVYLTSDASNKLTSTIRLTTDVLRDAVGKAKRLKDAW